jgi:copper chaperone
MTKEYHQFSVLGMSCEHCRARVQEALERVRGVCEVEIDLETGMVNVEAEIGATSQDDLTVAVEKVGYEVGMLSTP